MTNTAQEIEYLETEQDRQNETTRYWFVVDDDLYAVTVSGPDKTILDCDGAPIDGRYKTDYYIGMQGPDIALYDELYRLAEREDVTNKAQKIGTRIGS